MILSNEMPRLTDASGALPSRLIVLRLESSWYGNEDTTLTKRLLEERAGIFLWAVQGLKRLRDRGRFVQPESGEEVRRDMEELSSPVTAFVRERCELGPRWSAFKSDLFREWREWCQEHGHAEGSQATFGRNLKAAFPQLRESRPGSGVMRGRVQVGIGLPGVPCPV